MNWNKVIASLEAIVIGVVFSVLFITVAAVIIFV